MITFKTLIPLVVGLTTLSACVEPTTTAAPNTAAFSGPGSTLVTVADATTMFNSVCVQTAPSFTKAASVLASMPFQQNPATGTYFHKNLNLSVKLANGGCSMVFVSEEATPTLGLALAMQVSAANGQNSADIGMDASTGGTMTQGPAGTTFTFRPSQNGAVNFYQALLQ